MDILTRLKCKIYPAASEYFSHATLIEGQLRDGEEIFRCLFVENDDLMDYMASRMYREPPVVLKRWRTWIPSLPRLIDRHSEHIDMAVAVLPCKYESRLKDTAPFKSQTLICSSIDTSGGWDAVRKRFQHNKRQFCNKMDKNPMFHCRVSREPDDFDFFYHEMYEPHIRKRFQELAFVDSYESMKDLFLRGFLLFIEDNGKRIAGILCEIQNGTLFSRRTGVLHGDEDYIKKGASSAEYYYMLKYALENGLSKVDLLRSRPFLNDGVYTTKRKWGAMVCPNDQSDTWVYFFIPRYTSKIIRFFETNPIVSWKEDKMYAVVGWGGVDPLSEKDRKKITDQYYSPGLDGLFLIRPDSKGPVHIDFT